MIQEMIKSGVTKILCTSKGVLADLNKKMLLPLPGIKFDEQLTNQFELKILRDLNGSSKRLKNPFCMVYIYKGKKIYAIAIPSPGSPQRQVHNFGCTSDKKLEYANKYFKIAFNWLKK